MENKELFKSTSSLGRICSVIAFVFWSLAGIAQDSGEKELLEKANLGNPEAQYKIGGSLFEKKEFTKAFEWYSKAAMQGYAAAECDMSYCYYAGIGVEKNVVKAFEWYSKAAMQGYAAAEFNVGCCYDAGIGVEKNAVKAFEWYSKAAMQGYAAAEFNVGCCYNAGIGVEKNEKKCWSWMVKSANNGYLNAQKICYQNYKAAGSEWMGIAIKYILLASQQEDEEAKRMFKEITGMSYDNLGSTYKNNIKMYTGEYPIKFKGSAVNCSYQYYEIGDIRIYHGIFEAKSKAIVRTKEGKTIPVLTIKGQFKDGYRDGVWSIQYQYGDSNNSCDRIKITYQNGNIDGSLEDLSPIEKINAEYKNNTLIKFLWNNNKGESVEAHMDDEGYMHGAYFSKRKNKYNGGEVIRKGNFVHGISEDYSELYVQTGDVRRGIISKTGDRKVMDLYDSEIVDFMHNDFRRGLEGLLNNSSLSTVYPISYGLLEYRINK